MLKAKADYSLECTVSSFGGSIEKWQFIVAGLTAFREFWGLKQTMEHTPRREACQPPPV